jgi:hypothetical protein
MMSVNYRYYTVYGVNIISHQFLKRTSFMLRDIWTAAVIGWIAFGIARYCGIPVWFDWPSLDHPFDATDVGIFTALAVFNLIGKRT